MVYRRASENTNTAIPARRSFRYSARTPRKVAEMTNNLRALRVRKGLTQAQLAQAIDVEQPTIQRWESGKRKLKVEDLPKLALALGCDPTDLVSDGVISSVSVDLAEKILDVLSRYMDQYPAAAPHLSAIFSRCTIVLQGLEGSSPSHQAIEAVVRSELLRLPEQ